MRTAIAVALACVISAMAAVGQAEKVFPVGPGGRLFGNPDFEALLERPYEADVPMACVGECLWAAHPDGWAFGNGVHYYLLSPSGIGFDLTIESQGAPVNPFGAVCDPSHVRMKGGAGDLDIAGWKWISSDDVLGVRVSATNRSNAPMTLWFALRLPSPSVDGNGDRFSWTVGNPSWQIVQIGRAAGFVREEKAPETNVYYMTEGETPKTQKGSQGQDEKPAASGGQVLGRDFGGDEGDFAEWRIDVKAPIEDAVLAFRYSRAMAGDAEYKITVPSANLVERYGFQSTGGWGERPEDFKVATLHLGKLEAGPQTVRIVAVANGDNVNFDAVCIQPAGASFPALGAGETRFVRDIKIGAGETQTVDIFVAAGTQPARAEAALARVVGLADPVQDQIRDYTSWVDDNVPAFQSDDEAIHKMYWHRATSIVRKNLFRAGEGRLKRWAIAEGRWNSGWYPNVISYGAGHQIRETRWLRDPMYARDIVATWCENEKDNGVFPSFIRPNEIGTGQYTDWIAATAWDAYCVAPDLDVLAQWDPALKRNVDGWLATYDSDDDGLLLVDSHWWTGMEWQPSFFYFNGFDKDKQNQHLERVDLTAYVYGGAANLARILETLGEAQDAARYTAIASKIRDAAARVMWDDATQYFYSVEPETHDKALVKEIIGVYPFYFSMFPADAPYAAAWRSVLNPDELWTTWPVASASKRCPAYSQDVTFNGKQVGGCMWNGPTWPHANSLVLSAMAATLREFPNPPLLPSHFHALLKSFTVAQYRDQDIMFPWTGEYYNGDDAKWRTGERDYDHSTYIDIVIADMAGLRPRPDEILELQPILDPMLKNFLVDGIRYHGHDVTIAWNEPGSNTTSPDKLEGYRAYVDGKLVFHAKDGGKPIRVGLRMDQGFAEVPLPASGSF